MTTTEERISLWLDGELSADEAAGMEQLCRTDAAVAARVAALRSVDGLVRQAVPLQPVPPELLGRLGLSDAAPNNLLSLPLAKPRRGWSFGGLAANDFGRIAAAVTVLLGIGLTANTWVGIADRTPAGADYRTLSNDADPPSAGNALVVFAPGVAAEEASMIVRGAGGKLAAQTPAGAWQVQIASERQAETLSRLRSHPNVLMAEPLDGGAR